MKRFICAVFLVSFFAKPVYGSAPIAIVDREKIISDSLVFKSVGKQIDKERTNLQKEFSEKESALKKKNEELEHQKSILSKESLKEMEGNFQKEFIAVQNDVNAKRNRLETMYINSMKKMYAEVRKVSESIAETEGYDLVLFLLKQEQVLYSTKAVDISDKVVAGLNKEMPDLNIEKVLDSK